LSASTHHTPALKHHFEDLGQQHACERLGIWMFLATEILFFGGIFGAYTMYRLYYPHEFEVASSHLNRMIASINTVFLITSSLTMTLAIRSAKLGDKGAVILRVSDPFATMRFRVRAGDGKVMQLTQRNPQLRAMFLGYQYNFGRPPRVRQVAPEQTGGGSVGFGPPGA